MDERRSENNRRTLKASDRTVTRTITAILSAVFVLTATLPAGAISWRDTVDSALEESARTGKPVLLLVSAGIWCDPCVWLEDNTLEESSIRSLVNAGFIPVRIPDTEPGWERWDVRRLPTVLVLNPDGTELARVAGAVTAPVLQQHLAPLAATVRRDDRDTPTPTTEERPRSSLDALRGAVFRIGSAGTLWNDGGANWYSQDAGLPPQLEEYDRDETFLYLRDRSSATLLGVPLDRPREGSPLILWRWNLDRRDWEQVTELLRLD